MTTGLVTLATRNAGIADARRSGSCTWRRYGREQEKPIHIGEIHLLNARGLKVKWDYANEADTTATLGLSLSPNKNWADGGTHTATNSIGTDSGFTVGNRHLLRWVVGDAYFQRYSRNVLCAGYPYKNQLDHMAGDSWMGGTGKHHNIAPKPNPYHGCLKSNDPYGNAQVHPGDHFASDRAVATTVSGGATVYGFSFSDSTGYTSSIHHDYTNKSRSTVYLCGKGYMPDVPMLYNGNV